MRNAATTAAAATALIEYDDAIELRIEETAMDRGRAGAWPAMQEQHRHSLGIAALLPVDRVATIDRQHADATQRVER